MTLLQKFKRSISKNYKWLALVAFFCGGVIFHFLDQTRPLLLSSTEILLWVVNFFLLYSLWIKNHQEQSMIEKLKLTLWLSLAFLITLSLEIMGVMTGHVFGNYVYGSVFRIQIMGTPLVIGLNWVILILGTNLITSKLWKSIQTGNQKIFSAGAYKFLKYFLISLVSAVLMVVFDIILEPVAWNLGYWYWLDGFIPLQNYLAWFWISLIFSLFWQTINLKIEAKNIENYFWIITAFFICLNLVLRIG